MPTLDLEKIKKEIIDSQLWRSVFRGGVWKDTPRDRAGHIIGNVWLHLHPVKIRPRALKWAYSWGMGGISFALYLLLTLTGVALMFYYRPTIGLAYRTSRTSSSRSRSACSCATPTAGPRRPWSSPSSRTWCACS